MIHKAVFPNTSIQQQNILNNSLYLARKYAQIFVHGIINLFRDANSFPRAKLLKLEENWEFRGTDKTSIRGQKYPGISYFRAKWRLESSHIFGNKGDRALKNLKTSHRAGLFERRLTFTQD